MGAAASWRRWRGHRVAFGVAIPALAAFVFIFSFSFGAAYVPALGLLTWSLLADNGSLGEHQAPRLKRQVVSPTGRSVVMSGPSATDGRDLARIAVLGFVLLTFALTWTAWLAPTALGAPRNTGFFGIGGPVFLLGVFAPAFVALALTAYGEGRAGVGRLLARIGRWQVGARWYLFAIGYMAATKLIAALIHRTATGAWPAFGDTPLPLMLGAILVSTWVQAGEEVGWRGYALPRLATHLGLGGASVFLGVIWGIWHLPLFFLQGSGSEGQSFPIYLLHVTTLSVAMSWLYWKTEGSLLLVMLMHASVNNTSGIVPAAVSNPVDAMSFNGSLVAWVTVGVSSVVAAVLLWRMRGAGIGAMLDSESRRP